MFRGAREAGEVSKRCRWPEGLQRRGNAREGIFHLAAKRQPIKRGSRTAWAGGQLGAGETTENKQRARAGHRSRAQAQEGQHQSGSRERPPKGLERELPADRWDLVK